MRGSVAVNDSSGNRQFEIRVSVKGRWHSQIKHQDAGESSLRSGCHQYKPSLFSTKLELRFKSLQHAQEFTEADANEVVFELKRRDRSDAKAFVRKVKLQLVSKDLDSMLEMTNETLGQ